jgi:hypothetical protein
MPQEAPETPFLLNRLGINCMFHGKGVKVDVVGTFWQNNNSRFVDCQAPYRRNVTNVKYCEKSFNIYSHVSLNNWETF